MNTSHKLAIFDIDGTIAIQSNIPPSVLAGIKHIQSLGYTTTVSTGRGYVRAKEALGDNFDTIISKDALLVLEQGTKITDSAGKVIFAEYFSTEEIDHIVEFLRANIEIIKLVWYNPPNPSHKPLVWCSDPKYLDEEVEKRSHYAEVFCCPFGELRKRLLNDKISNVTYKLHDFVQVHNLKLSLTRTATNIIFQDGNAEFVKNNINKGLSVVYLLKKYGIGFTDLLVAGNAINDVDMLNLDAGKRVLVGTKAERDAVLPYLSLPNEAVHVQSPDALGEYLQTL